MAFDISTDGKNMVLVSNRTVFTIKWKKGLKDVIQTCNEYTEI
jgi:hypothetical protein